VYFGYGLITSTMICSGMLDITVRRDAVLGQWVQTSRHDQ